MVTVILPFTGLPVHLARNLQSLSSSSPAPLPGSSPWPCQIARSFCDRHKWGLGWDHPACFHLQARPGCKPECPEEKADSTNPLCHLACTAQRSYSAAASTSFWDVLWLCNNQPPKNCSFPAMTAKFSVSLDYAAIAWQTFLTQHILHPSKKIKLNALMIIWTQHLMYWVPHLTFVQLQNSVVAVNITIIMLTHIKDILVHLALCLHSL